MDLNDDLHAADRKVTNASVELQVTKNDWQQYARQLLHRLDAKSDFDSNPFLKEQIAALATFSRSNKTKEERASALFLHQSVAQRMKARQRRRERQKQIQIEKQLLLLASAFSNKDEITDVITFYL